MTVRARYLAIAAISAASLMSLASCMSRSPAKEPQKGESDALSDTSSGTDWPAYGRTYGEQHFSPLTQVADANVGKLGLAWSYDLPNGNSSTGPLEIGGTLYVVTGYSVVRALDAASGRLLWEFDPHVPEASGDRLRTGWGVRGIGYWNGKIFTGTQDGRLIAIDAKTGKQAWSAQTFDKVGNYRFISGPPRAFKGIVLIGHGGADTDNVRGYVTAYDADTGKQLWRFWTVPGNPAKGFENDAMRMAAKTWAGEWWKYGGGGTVWNSITYDEKFDTVLIGVGNGAPWNRKIRSLDKGDNLFLSSIVALDAKTGAYKWHYQTNPGETWDYNASMDMELADLNIDGHMRSVVMTAPKNGFFYVIDRSNGKLLSAKPIAKVTWASGIDLKTGRPIENPKARYPNGETFTLWPSLLGAHSWMPMAYSPVNRLVYIPTIEMATSYTDTGIDLKNWKRTPGNFADGGTIPNSGLSDAGPLNRTSRLQAWDPVAQRPVWQVPTPGGQNGSVLATAGNLVFQGRLDGEFVAHDGRTGQRLWAFKADSGIIGPPISYSVNGVQYVTVLTGIGTAVGMFAGEAHKPILDYRAQARRVLTFKLGGTAHLPAAAPQTAMIPPTKWDFTPDAAAAKRGGMIYGSVCGMCHGLNGVAGGDAPDLRGSPIPANRASFATVVRDGALVPAGMPRFEEFSDQQLDDLRQYVRQQARATAK